MLPMPPLPGPPQPPPPDNVPDPEGGPGEGEEYPPDPPDLDEG